MAYTYIHVGRGADAVRVFEPIVEAARATLAPDSTEFLNQLNILRMSYRHAERRAEEAALEEQILAICVKKFGEDHQETEWVRVNLAKYRLPSADCHTVLPVLQKAYARFQKHCRPTSSEVLWTRSQLGLCLLACSRPAEAVPHLKGAYDYNRSQYGPDHLFIYYAARDLSTAYEESGRYRDAVPLRWRVLMHPYATGDAERFTRYAVKLVEDVALMCW